MTMICRAKKVEENRWRRRRLQDPQHGALSGTLESSGLLAGTESWGQGWRKQAEPTVGEGTIR